MSAAVLTTNGHNGAHTGQKMPTHTIEVNLKPGFNDPAGNSLLGQLQTLGINGVQEIRVGTLYRLSGKLSFGQTQTVAKDLLSDPITQEFTIWSGERPQNQPTSQGWRIEVWLKSSVSDPTGESVVKAVADLGFPRPESARTGTVYRLQGRVGSAAAQKVAVRLLANPVVHRYTLTPC